MIHPALFSRYLLLWPLCLLLVQCSSEPDNVTTSEDGAQMLLIESGEFPMGGRPEDVEGLEVKNYINYVSEGPVHQVKISGFYLDKFETTNALYRRFIESGDRTADHPDQPDNLDHQQQYADENLLGDNQPAVGLNWFDAYAYCKWAGKRLPTEAEWEYAARGAGVYRKYPWGNDAPDADGIWRANYHPQEGAARDGKRYSSDVGSFPDGISAFGIMDMAGNAEEWVQDWLDFGYYNKIGSGTLDPQGPASGSNKVIKGGSYGSDKYHVRIATRLYGAPHVKTELQGFRCAMDIDG